MKKKEILSIIAGKRAKSSFRRHYPGFWRVNDNDLQYFVNSENFRDIKTPDIPELSSEFELLKKELLSKMDAVNEGFKQLQSIKCEHELRLTYYSMWTSHRCVLCGEGNLNSLERSWSKSDFRSKYYVNFDSYDQPDCDGPIATGYEYEDIFKLIEKILEDKNDDDEIDLVEEIDKINKVEPMKSIEISKIKPRKQTKIVIIGGTNKEFFDRDSCITKDKTKMKLFSAELMEFFKDILDTKVLLIDNEEVINEMSKEIDSFKYRGILEGVSYSSVKSLESALSKIRVPIDLIINASELYDYEIKGEKITKQEHQLDLSQFPNATVVNIKDLSSLSFDELKRYIQDIKNECFYGYKSDEYYFMSDKYVRSLDSEKAFSRIRKQIIKDKK